MNNNESDLHYYDFNMSSEAGSFQESHHQFVDNTGSKDPFEDIESVNESEGEHEFSSDGNEDNDEEEEDTDTKNESGSEQETASDENTDDDEKPSSSSKCSAASNDGANKKRSASINTSDLANLIPSKKEKPTTDENLRYDQLSHWPMPDLSRNNRSRCKKPNCKKFTNWYCSKCNKHFCIKPKNNCFTEYHNK